MDIREARRCVLAVAEHLRFMGESPRAAQDLMHAVDVIEREARNGQERQTSRTTTRKLTADRR